MLDIIYLRNYPFVTHYLDIVMLLYFVYINAISAEFIFTYRKAERMRNIRCIRSCDRDSGSVCDLVTRILDRSSCALIGEAAHGRNIYRQGGFLAFLFIPSV